MTTVKQIPVMPSAKLHGITMGIAGFVCGILYSVGGALWELATDDLNGGTALAFIALIGMPLIFATSGAVVGAVGTFLFNRVARRFGNWEIGLER